MPRPALYRGKRWRVGPLGGVPAVSKLVEVHALDMVTRGESAMLALRWQATGPAGRLFPALDADMVLHRVADATARSLLARVADLLARPEIRADAVPGTGIGGSGAACRAAPEPL